jgi:uncharacterized protein
VKKPKLIYTADLHGNESQYKKVVEYCIKISADAIIVGGDICPKDHSGKYLEIQAEFIKNKLPQYFKILKEKLPDCEIYIMMGNDDCKGNSYLLQRFEPELFTVIHNKRLKFNGDFEIVGYSNVPITPFGLKDWEKYDLSDSGEKTEEYNERKKSCQLNGYKTSKSKWEKFAFTPDIEKLDSIQNDLKGEIFIKNQEKTVYVFHTPPNYTNLDMTHHGHVGSFAVKEFIEKKSPCITLHGHIHETVEVSGNFKEKIGKTWSLSSGNDSTKEGCAIVVFDPYNPKDAKRFVI